MKIKKSLLSVCLSILFIAGSFVPCINVQAEGLWSNLQNYTYFNSHFYKIEEKLDGIIWNIENIQSDFYQYLDDHSQDLNISNNDYENWIGSNITSDGVEISFSSSLRQALRVWGQDYIEANCGYKYVYSYTGSAFQSSFDNLDSYNSFLSIIQNNQNDYIYINKPLSNPVTSIWVIDHTKVYLRLTSYQSSYATYDTDIMYLNNGSATFYVPKEYITYYSYNSTTGLFSQENLNNSTYNFICNTRADQQTAQNFDIGSKYLVSFNLQEYQGFLSVNSLQNAAKGIQDYYISNNYNNSINGSYNNTITNIDNSITAGDVNNYITNYYEDNGHYPSENEIKIYINVVFPTPTPTPSPGPDPTPSPGPDPGPGDDDEGGNIWDFLREIGDILGNLIATLGEVVAGLISALSNIITSLITSFPNVIGGLIQYFLPFLPEEVTTVISLSIVLSIIVGIVKLIRG